MAVISSYSKSQQVINIPYTELHKQWRSQLDRNRELSVAAKFVLLPALDKADLRYHRSDLDCHTHFSCRLKFIDANRGVVDTIIYNKKVDTDGYKLPPDFFIDMSSRVFTEALAQVASGSDLLCKLCLIYADEIASQQASENTDVFNTNLWSTAIMDEYSKNMLLKKSK